MWQTVPLLTAPRPCSSGLGGPRSPTPRHRRGSCDLFQPVGWGGDQPIAKHLTARIRPSRGSSVTMVTVEAGAGGICPPAGSLAQ